MYNRGDKVFTIPNNTKNIILFSTCKDVCIKILDIVVDIKSIIHIIISNLNINSNELFFMYFVTCIIVFNKSFHVNFKIAKISEVIIKTTLTSIRKGILKIFIIFKNIFIIFNFIIFKNIKLNQNKFKISKFNV
jgi:hypothetical protein